MQNQLTQTQAIDYTRMLLDDSGYGEVAIMHCRPRSLDGLEFQVVEFRFIDDARIWDMDVWLMEDGTIYGEW